jgi:hypothetical protein
MVTLMIGPGGSRASAPFCQLGAESAGTDGLTESLGEVHALSAGAGGRVLHGSDGQRLAAAG